MNTADLDYALPPELIAQQAMEPRDAARLLHVPLDGGVLGHRIVRDLPELLRPGDLLVLNRTRVIPARLLGAKDTGGAAEVLLVHPLDRERDGGAWRCLVRAKVHPGSVIRIGPYPLTVAVCHEDGHRDLLPPPGHDLRRIAEELGHVPLPPYIDRADTPADRERYQTVFGDIPGSVAAPTAGLHLTPAVLDAIAARGVRTAKVELAIGPGTFKPIDTERVEDYRIHAEWCQCPGETADAVNATRAAGGRVIAVGTTAVRTLETAWRDSAVHPWSGWTQIYLHPPMRLHAVDGLMTNFHLPRSSLLALVACLCGLERLHAVYAEAVRERYRFYSYGDASLYL